MLQPPLKRTPRDPVWLDASRGTAREACGQPDLRSAQRGWPWDGCLSPPLPMGSAAPQPPLCIEGTSNQTHPKLSSCLPPARLLLLSW